MPYIIITRTEGRQPGREFDSRWSRRAVATLDDVRDAIHEAIGNAGGTYPLRILNQLAGVQSGGTVGPLPDGTVIEVETATGFELWERAGRPGTAPWATPDPYAPDEENDRVAVDAYNAKQAAA